MVDASVEQEAEREAIIKFKDGLIRDDGCWLSRMDDKVQEYKQLDNKAKSDLDKFTHEHRHCPP